MNRDLEGKTALVTGGSRGIGRAIATSLADRGASIVIAYLRRREAAWEACADLETLGVKTMAVPCNVGDEGELESLFASIEDTFGRLDVFVSNAATGVIRPAVDLDTREWAWMMDANARALLLGARLAKPLMSDGGCIVALSSLGSVRVLPGHAVVGASKAAVESLVRYLAVELAPKVRVNAVSPGVVDTEALMHFPMREEMLSRAAETTPLGRLVDSIDVAQLVSFLTSSRAGMITGQTIVIDGGSALLA